MIVLKDNLVKIGNSAIIGSGYKRFNPHQANKSMPTHQMSKMSLTGSGLVGKSTTIKKKTINFL